jgi:hypothetical protein
LSVGGHATIKCIYEPARNLAPAWNDWIDVGGMMEPDDEELLLDNIKLIEAYTRDNAELTQSHHFLYDLRIPKGSRAKFVVMGINPGESPRFCANAPGPTEETSRFDWIESVGLHRPEIPWSELCNFYLDTAPYVMTELFFWSSRNVPELEVRLGEPLCRSRHLPFCVDMNLALISVHRPRAVVVVGLGAERLCREHFGLRKHDTVRSEGVRVAEQYFDGDGRPWLITKHWTGARSFTTGQRNSIQGAIRGLGFP